MRRFTAAVVAALFLAGCGHSSEPTRYAEYQSEDITFEAADGTVLAGTLHVKDTAAPAVVLFHQLGSNRNEWQPLRLALQEATEATVLAMDLRGHGQSTERGEETLDWQDFTTSDWAELPGDVANSLAYIRKRSDLSPPSYGLAGSSIGSSAVLLDAATDSGVASIVLLSPGLAYRGLETEQPMVDYGDRPALLVATDGDVRSANAVGILADENPSATGIVYSGSSAHGVAIAEENPELTDELSNWFADTL